MKVKYNAQKGQRFKRRFTWITCNRTDIWLTVNCNSIKAFKRRVARMDKSLVGVTFQLSHIFFNTKVENRLYYSAFITKKK